MHEFIFGIVFGLIGSKFFSKKKRPVQKDAEVQAFVIPTRPIPILNSKMSYLKNFWGYDS
jgi:hypothetical protein